jgi:hypothetical protein
MTDERSLRVDRQAASWLAEGPTRAPEHLLAEALARSNRERQRPALLARALGAPDGARRTTWTRPPLVWLAAALLLMAGLAAAISIASSLLESRLVVVPVPSASPGLTARPSEPAPSQPVPSFVAPIVTEAYENGDLGVQLRYVPGTTTTGFTDVWTGWFGAPGTEAVAVTWVEGRCVDTICSGYVGISSGTLAEGAIVGTVGANPDELSRVAGTTLDELVMAFTALAGPGTATPTTLDSEPAVRVVAGSARTILAIHGGRVFGLTSLPTLFGSGALQVLEDARSVFRFADVAVAFEGPRTTFEAAHLATPLPKAWEVLRGTESVVFLTGYGLIPGTFDLRYAVRFTVTSKLSGLAAARLAELGQRGSTNVIRTTVGADPTVILLDSVGTEDATVALIGHGDRVFRVEVVVTPDLGSGEAELRQFLAGFEPLE